MEKKEIFEKLSPKSLEKGEYIVFCCEDEETTILNIKDIIKIEPKDDDVVIITKNQNYYPVPDTITYIEIG